MDEKYKKLRIPTLPRVSNLFNKKAGAPPGTIVHTGEKKVDEMIITGVDYSTDYVEDLEIESPELLKKFVSKDSVTWLSVCGLHEVTKIQEIGRQLDIHPLVLEDIANTDQRPKREEYENYLFIVLRIIFYDSNEETIRTEQLSLLLGAHHVLSIQESNAPYFEFIRKRLDVKDSRIRAQGSSYLAYAIIDTTVDYYFQVMAVISERIEKIEDELVDDPTRETHDKIHALRRDLIGLRKAVWPMRDILNSLIRDESKFIDDQTKIYLRDVYEHVIQIIDHIESSRDLVRGMFDSYMSAESHKMNEVMKVLTIIATIFIPLTFIAGIYGMNFNSEVSPYNMPELGYYYGYPAVMALMVVIFIGMLIYFKFKNWL